MEDKLRTMNTNSNKTYHLFFSNLSNPLRIEIVSALKKAEKGLSVGELASALWVSQSKLSHALAKLKKCNLVTSETRGKKRIYSLNRKTLVPILDLIDQHSHTYCNGNCMYCSRQEEKIGK